MSSAACPPAEQLRQLAAGVLAGQEVQRLESHLLGCDRCVRQLRAWEQAAGEPPSTFDPQIGLETPPAIVRRIIQGATAPPPEEKAVSDSLPQIAGYDVLEQVGSGGMGHVYRARHRLLGREVAIKGCHSRVDEVRFRREAQILAKLQSPHVVAVHDFVEGAGGQTWLVMEWVPGTDLFKRIREAKGPLPEEEVVAWMRQVCEGMLAAAEQGVVHRDLKPSNVLIDGAGRARVADFGLARSAEHESLTLGSQPMGTAPYMPPEQAEDPRSVDTRADIYSFGATFYHALTGRPPFQGDSFFSVLFKAKTEPLPAARSLNPQLSEWIAVRLERCLAKTPHERYASFAELRRALGSTEESPLEASADPRLQAALARFRERRALYFAEEFPWNEFDRFELVHGELHVGVGDITKQRTQVLVSSDNEYLTMSYGVSEALRRAGGPQVAEEASRFGPVRPGRAVVTSAGDLPARFIFHGVTFGYTAGRTRVAESLSEDGLLVIHLEEMVVPSRNLITEILESCLYHADTLKVRSISFPLLGTGAMRFDQSVCLDTMFSYLAKKLVQGLTTLREVRICLFRRTNQGSKAWNPRVPGNRGS